MADVIRKIDYYYASVPDTPGEAARILSALHEAGVNLVAFSGFPKGARKAQLDFLPEDPAAFVKAARKIKLALSRKKTGFLIQAEDRPGAAAELLGKLAAANINVTAMQAISAGEGRYAGLLWVNSADLNKAAKALGAV